MLSGTLGVLRAYESSDDQQLGGSTGSAEPQGAGQGMSQLPMNATNIMDAQKQPSSSMITKGVMLGGLDANKAVPNRADSGGQRQLPRSLHQLGKTAKTACKHQVELQQIKQILRSDPELFAAFTKQRFGLRQKQRLDRITSSNPSN